LKAPPEQVVEKELARHVKFPEVAYLEIETKLRENKVTLKITDFQFLPPHLLDLRTRALPDTTPTSLVGVPDTPYPGCRPRWGSPS